MATHKNFYETIEEASMRLRTTIIMYDGQPYYVWTVTNHKGDGVFRIFMSPIEAVGKGKEPPAIHQIPNSHPALGEALDAYVDKKTPLDFEILRKRMDSPLFNKFRPFPLGMMNSGTQAIYIERRPNRPKTEQGLTAAMLHSTIVSAGTMKQAAHVQMFSPQFRDCILADHPSPKECLQGLCDDNMNESVAFHRHFALVRGPIGTMFLAYKADVIGLLPHNDFSAVRLGREHKHVKEAVEELRLFASVS